MSEVPLTGAGATTTADDATVRAPFRTRREMTSPKALGYRLLPFRFTDLDAKRFVATNFAGQHVVLPKETLRAVIRHALGPDDPVVVELEARLFLRREGSDVAVDLLATQYRSRMAHLADFTALHIFVTSLRCDTSCPYCQVSRVSEDRLAFDMRPDVADRSVDLVFRSPSPTLKIEFQGGEPLLNFPLIRRIVERALDVNRAARRDLSFVVCTNLAPLTREMAEYFREKSVVLSTSLDGPRELHVANRPRAAGDSYEATLRGIAMAREILGQGGVSALMTTTRRSLEAPEAIVDEYARLGFSSVFLRPLNPFGFAVTGAARLAYSTEEWSAFYERALRHILRLNREGIAFREDYAALILRRLLTPHATGFVDLQSPTGLGIAVALYNYDGDVYMSDESRMLAAMGDRTFRLGNVLTDSYEALFYSERLQRIVMDTMSEGIPQCSTCAFQPTCGTEPTFHHATQGDMVGHRPTSGFCQRTMHATKFLVTLLEDEPESAEILRQWAY